MSKLEFNPLPREEESHLRNTIMDILQNGTRMPQDVSMELIFAAVMEQFTMVARIENQARTNAFAFKWLSVGVLALAFVVVAHVGPQVEFLKPFFAALGG